MSIVDQSVAGLRRLLVSREISPGEVVRELAAEVRSRGEEVGAYLAFDEEAAVKLAEKADLSLPLGGVPVAVKDNINVKGDPCSCGSKMLAGGYVAPYDAGCMEQLRAAGVIPLGRTNMDEFAMGSSTENSALGVTRNPWDLSRVPGGSSGGSAAAVGAHLAIAALGSDTGGSIRQPAAFCGCVGLKPTYGRVSRYGLVAFASSLDQIGPMTKTVEDSALLLNHLCGKDGRDSTSLDEPVPDFTAVLGKSLKGLRAGLPKEYFIDGIDPAVRASVDAAVKVLEELGVEIEEISLPHTELAIATYYIVAPAEASTNLSRFDGVRYGYRAEGSGDLLEHYMASRAEGFGPEVKRRILLGTYVLSSGYYDAYYVKAQRARALIREDFTQAFKKVDFIVSPTTPELPFKLGALKDDPLSMYLADLFTIPPNLAGLPALSLPCGLVEEGGARLSVGLQLIGRALDESTLIQVAHAYEQSTPWHLEKPTR
ncbi:Asp-tRNA(Asn)/Glu-tRNA(Gln) amidotransferase subunit GatA [Phragmitibacter flavus]|uniref:Glutamyl-tRNA(Gln) amidotransferase subunit A n=1 Tax=Phragmitibacter flavus TaxID=2576071 RepID=A0A5R8KDC2_9BACT|nr:Asp-tRNA(Asn)/Glu-tRNA(Gln) amidotransferase subunit GatA [Phragmitibacter flavus]TLD69589.1 Asp-tRNA(Asn)/Glu-tRNA(Gln) amidotransferase subunit GatA [Phragmitibacter flavus]